MSDYGGFSLDQIAQAVMQVESSGGTNAKPRYEPGFERRYLSKRLEPDFEQLRTRYGSPAMATSYGPFQVLYRTAYEHGFRGSPQELALPAVNRQYFERKFTKDFDRVKTLRGALLRYNGGGDPTYPDKVLQHLNQKRTTTQQVQQRMRRP